MAYSGNEISYMDYRSQKIYNNYGSYNYGSAAYELDFQRKLKEEKRKETEEERRKKQAARERAERRINLMHSVQLVAAAGLFFFGCVLTITAVSSVTEMRYDIT